MTALPLDLIYQSETDEQALENTMTVAASVGLPTTVYEVGDPILAVLETFSKRFGELTRVIAPGLAGGLLDYAEGDFLTLLAAQVYGVTRDPQTFASTEVTLAYAPGVGAPYVISENELTFENSATSKTYKNTTPVAPATVVLSPGNQVTLVVVADEAGSASSSGATEIDRLVSTMLGVSVSNATAAVGRDRESDDALRARCRLKVPAISKTAAGPKGKYTYVAITPEENGGAGVTRADVRGNGVSGAVQVVIATPSGAATSDDRDLVETALVKYVIGPTETLSVVLATEVTIAVTYELWVYDDVNLDDTILKQQIATRLGLLFSVCPIGGWRRPVVDANGKVFVNLLEGTIKGTTTRAFQVVVTVPAGDVDLGADDVPVLGVVGGTVTRVAAPATGGTL